MLTGERFIERVKCGFWDEVNNAIQQQGITPQTVMQTDSDEFVLSLVDANLGVSIITNRVTPYNVVFISIEDISINRSIGVCVSPSPTPKHVRTFYETLIKQYDGER